MRVWNGGAHKCNWCVFLRIQDDDEDEEEDPEQGAVKRAAAEKLPRMARVAGGSGDRHHLKTRDVKFESLIGWSNEREALGTLYKVQTFSPQTIAVCFFDSRPGSSACPFCFQAKFDIKAAVAAMEASYATTGYWRDKFVEWESDEASMLCECAVRHHDNVAELAGVLGTKSVKEVVSFYDHFLRNSHDQTVVERLFATAAYTREAGGITDPDANVLGRPESKSAGEVRKSKRERSTNRRKAPLPGEAPSDEDGDDMLEAATKRSKLDKGGKAVKHIGGDRGSVGSWSAEYLEQNSRVSERQKDLLRRSFKFLHTAQASLEGKKFMRLVKNLVDYDKGTIEVPAMVAAAAECLQSPDPAKTVELLELFRAFLPDKARPMLKALCPK